MGCADWGMLKSFRWQPESYLHLKLQSEGEIPSHRKRRWKYERLLSQGKIPLSRPCSVLIGFYFSLYRHKRKSGLGTQAAPRQAYSKLNGSRTTMVSVCAYVWKMKMLVSLTSHLFLNCRNEVVQSNVIYLFFVPC